MDEISVILNKILCLNWIFIFFSFLPGPISVLVLSWQWLKYVTCRGSIDTSFSTKQWHTTVPLHALHPPQSILFSFGSQDSATSRASAFSKSASGLLNIKSYSIFVSLVSLKSLSPTHVAETIFVVFLFVPS